METAWAAGFNALSLAEEEEDLLPSGSQEKVYVEVCQQSDARLIAIMH